MFLYWPCFSPARRNLSVCHRLLKERLNPRPSFPPQIPLQMRMDWKSQRTGESLSVLVITWFNHCPDWLTIPCVFFVSGIGTAAQDQTTAATRDVSPPTASPTKSNVILPTRKRMNLAASGQWRRGGRSLSQIPSNRTTRARGAARTLLRTNPGLDLQRQPQIRAPKTKAHLSAPKMNLNPRDPTTKPQTEALTMTATNFKQFFDYFSPSCCRLGLWHVSFSDTFELVK